MSVPDSVDSVSITFANSTSITVSWQYSNPSTSYTGFQVSAAPSGGGHTKVAILDSSGLVETLTDLIPGTVYDVTVKAMNGDQLSGGISTTTFTCE